MLSEALLRGGGARRSPKYTAIERWEVLAGKALYQLR